MIFMTLRAMFRDREGKIILLWATAQILLGMGMYMWLEDWSAVDALYFSVVTLATVGFGDLHPTTTAAKLFTVGYILFGLGILAAFISQLTKQYAAAISRFASRAAPSDPDSETPSPGAASPQPKATDEDRT